MAFLDITDLRKQFGATYAVDTFNLSVQQGEFVSFLGPSSCGKTTTLRMIAGFESPTSGEIMLAGEDVTRIPTNRRQIGMVFQSYALFPNMTVADNIRFGLRVGGQSAQVMKERTAEMLELIHLPEVANRYPHQLSGGQQQRVALARALAIRPRLLLLDEPLSALDAKIRLSLRQEIRAIQRKLGISAIYVTHDQEEALSISDRVVVMNKGRVEQVGTPTEIYNTPQTQFVASFVGTLNLLEGRTVNRADNMISIDGQQLCVERIEPTGDVLSVALRPEAITLHREADVINALPHSNTLHGTVEDVYFLGSVVRIRTRLRDQFVNADTFNNPHANLPTPGEPVLLNFPPEACRVLI